MGGRPIGTDEHADVHLAEVALEDLQKQGLRVDKSCQPDMFHLVRQVRFRREFGTHRIMILQSLLFEPAEVVLFEDVQLGPAHRIVARELGLGDAQEVERLFGAPEGVAQLHQFLCERLGGHRGEAREGSVAFREQLVQLGCIAGWPGQDLHPGQQAGLLGGDAGITISPVEEVLRRLDLREQDAVGFGLGELLADQPGGELGGHQHAMRAEVQRQTGEGGGSLAGLGKDGLGHALGHRGLPAEKESNWGSHRGGLFYPGGTFPQPPVGGWVRKIISARALA